MPTQSEIDVPRRAITTVFVAYGAAVGVLAGVAPTLMRAAGVDSLAFGLGLAISTGATVLAMSLGGAVARVASNRMILLLGLPALWLMLMAFVTSQSPLWFFAAFIPMGFMFGLIDLFMNAEATAIEHDAARPILTTFHASLSATVAVHAIAASLIATALGPGSAALLAGLSFAAAWFLVYRNVPARTLVAGRAARIMALSNKMPLILLGLAAGLTIAAETAALLWSAKLLDDMAPSLAAIAGLGAAFYALCNAAVRFPGDWLRARFGEFTLMIASLCVAMTGFVILGLSRDFLVSVIAFAIVGLGLAILTPCMFAFAARVVPSNRAGGIGFISMLSGAPRAVTPWLFGWTAGAFGASAAFGLMALALAVALALVVALMRGQQTEIAA